MTESTDSGLPSPPRNLLAKIEYDGGGYCGWERQTNGTAIQEVFEETIRKITGEEVLANASGRTDTGVHAEGQMANFVLTHSMPVEELQRALNALLPADVAVARLIVVPLSFHARFSATSKTYRYTIRNDPNRSPLGRRAELHVRHVLDVEAMQQAADVIVGTHDFSSFCKEPERNSSCVRTVFRAEVVRRGAHVVIELQGDGFLYNMVRIIAGTLIAVGSQKMTPTDVAVIRDAMDRRLAGMTVPPQGLSLIEVHYDPGSLLETGANPTS